MESKQLGLQEYNEAILNVYGSNPVVQMSGSSGDDSAGTKELTGDPPGKKEKRIKKGTLFTETLKLKKAALLNLSLANRIFDYEQMRLKQLTVELLEADPKRKKAETESEKEKEDKEEKEGGFGRYFGRWLSRLFRKIKIDIKRRLGPRGRRAFRARRKRALRKLTRPIRQTRRFLTKTYRGVTRRLGIAARRAMGLRGRKFLNRASRTVRAAKVLGTRRLKQGQRFIKKTGESVQGLLKKGVAAGKTAVGKGIQAGKSLAAKGLDASKGVLGKAVESGKGIIGKGAEVGKNILGKAKSFGSNIVKGIAESPIAKRIGLATAKFGGRMIPVAGSAISAADAADRAKRGDSVGAWLAGLGGSAGLAATATAPAAATGAGAVVPAVAEATSMVADVALLGYDIFNAFRGKKFEEGGKVTGPQLALIGEGGESEYVVPESKLAYFLSGPTSIGLVNAGAKTLFTGVRKFADAVGLDSKILSSIPELGLEKQLPDTDIKVPVPPTDAKKPPQINLGRSILQKIIDGFKDLVKSLPKLLGGPLGAIVNGALNLGRSLTDGLSQLTDGDEKSASPYLTSGGVGPDAYVYSKFRSAKRPGHNGVDYSGGPFSKVGTPISVIMPGTVHHTGNDPSGWGNYVVVKHTNGRFTLYGHLNSINVSKGQKLEPDASGNAPVIGTLGSTGRSEGPHLHFEMGSGWNGRLQNHINPEPHAKSYFRAGGTKVTKKPDEKATDAPKVSGSGNLAGNLTPPSNPLALPSPLGINTMGNYINPVPESELPFDSNGGLRLSTGGRIQYVPVPMPVPTKSSNKPSSLYSTWGTTPNR